MLLLSSNTPEAQTQPRFIMHQYFNKLKFCSFFSMLLLLLLLLMMMMMTMMKGTKQLAAKQFDLLLKIFSDRL
jgi:hypothetical protein